MPNLPAEKATNAGQSPSDVPFIVNPARGDARNWFKRISSIFAPSGGRTFVKRTDDSFQDERAPLRIPRLFARAMGKTGPNENILPYTGSWAFIPGQNISMKSAGKATPALRTIDDNASIPAIYAGNAPQG